MTLSLRRSNADDQGRIIKVTDRHTAVDYAHVLKNLARAGLYYCFGGAGGLLAGAVVAPGAAFFFFFFFFALLFGAVGSAAGA